MLRELVPFGKFFGNVTIDFKSFATVAPFPESYFDLGPDGKWHARETKSMPQRWWKKGDEGGDRKSRKLKAVVEFHSALNWQLSDHLACLFHLVQPSSHVATRNPVTSAKQRQFVPSRPCSLSVNKFF